MNSDDTLTALAEALGEPVEHVQALLGDDWQQYPDDFPYATEPADLDHLDSPGDPVLMPGATTFAAGDPLSAFLTVVPDLGVAFVFDPVGQWVSPGTLAYGCSRPGGPIPVGQPKTLENIARSLIPVKQSSAAALRVCRYCGNDIRPEWWFGDDTCLSCASTELGVVH